MVVGSICGPISQTQNFTSGFKNEISSSALLDIQMTFICVCWVDSFIPELEHLIENPFPLFLFQKEAFEISFLKNRF